MEKQLIKMARQLLAYDEASLMALWDKYAAVVRDFEPSRRWEEAALVLSLIQSLRWKNQLFNHHWAASNQPGEESHEEPRGAEPADLLSEPDDPSPEPEPGIRRGKLLPFKFRDEE